MSFCLEPNVPNKFEIAKQFQIKHGGKENE